MIYWQKILAKHEMEFSTQHFGSRSNAPKDYNSFSVYIGTVFKETFIIQACQTHLLPNSCSALIINAAKVITLQQEITNTTMPIEK
jgi:hypothetical protein